MFGLINALNEDPPYLQVIPKHKHPKIHNNFSRQSPNYYRISSTKSSQNQSPFATKSHEIQNQNFQPINEATIQSNEKSEQNDIKKMKKYSKILETSNHLHKMYQPSSPCNMQVQSLIQEQSPQSFVGKERLKFQIQNVYNHYALKNQRKNRVLAKAKELGKNNFYRFLKQTSIIGSNHHIHRLYSNSKNLEKINNSPLKTRQMSPDEKTLIVVSLEPNNEQPAFDKKKKNLGVPKKIQRQAIRQKITLKTQMPLDHNLCLTTEGSSLSLKKSKSKKKQLIRNLTQINQKIRKKRKSHHEKQKLLFPTENLSMRDQQTFVSKWKYKSLFDSAEDANLVRKTVNEKKHLGMRIKIFTGHEISRTSKFEGTRLKGEDYFNGKVKFLKISRSKLMKKEIPELSLSGDISLNNSKLKVQL